MAEAELPTHPMPELDGPYRILTLPIKELDQLHRTSRGRGFLCRIGVPVQAELLDWWIDEEAELIGYLYLWEGWSNIKAKHVTDVPALDVLMIPFTMDESEVERLDAVTTRVGKLPSGLILPSKR
jgi:hypothetical protein